MVPYKGPDMLLDAAAPLLRDGRMTLDMIGDGPLLQELKAKAEAEGTARAVRFHGWLAHDKVQDVAAECALFAFPSIREFGGGVVLEAMALGLAPLIVDYAGPGELVTEETGFKVPLGPRADIVSAFRIELERIASAPEELGPIGERARARVESLFTWRRKAEQVAEVYDWVLGRRAARPTFF
jgi:glycosyltransferase involved in cell wall biosynthesis